MTISLTPASFPGPSRVNDAMRKSRPPGVIAVPFSAAANCVIRREAPGRDSGATPLTATETCKPFYKRCLCPLIYP